MTTKTWKTKYGSRRVRHDPPTLEEAIIAAQGLTDSVSAQVEIAAFSPTSYYSREYETLAAESMGSLQFREPDHSITIVLDRDNPVLAYLHKYNTTYSLNIYRENPPLTSDEYVRISELLSAGLPSSRATPVN